MTKKHFIFPEGATPIDDCSYLIPHWVNVLKDLNRVEAENILKAQKKYLRPPIAPPSSWMTTSKLKEIHHAMFKDVWQWAGQYRQSVTSIGIKPNLIPLRLAEFCHVVRTWFLEPVELTFLEMSARIHHQLVVIHPFENGNGRFSRFISDRFLLSLKCRHPVWPGSLSIGSSIRKKYIQALKVADSGDYTPLLNFMKKLGAEEPLLSTLLNSPFYRKFVEGKKGHFLIKALIRTESIKGHTLEEILKFL